CSACPGCGWRAGPTRCSATSSASECWGSRRVSAMELGEAIRRRRMVRNFEERPVPPEALERILDHARRAPSAGHTQGFAFLALVGAEQVGRFWDCTFPAGGRDGFRWPGLLRAPVIILPCASKEAYLDRYAEDDKGWVDRDEARWPVPYW